MIAGKREHAAALLERRPLRRLRTVPAWRGVLILNYHRVGDPHGSPFDHRLWSASADALDGHLRVLAREADVIGPPDLADALAGRGRHVMITFDDGYRDNHAIALPLLRAHGLRATFFLTTGFLDRPRAAWWDEIAWMVRHAARPRDAADADAEIAALTDRYRTLGPAEAEAFLDEVAERTGAGRCPPAAAAGEWMTWDMARELRDAGMWIGGHTVDHPILSTLPLDAQAEQIDGCAARLEAELGEPMRWFAYPVGHRQAFTQATGRLLTGRGVAAAFSFYGGYQPCGPWDPADVPRTHVGPRCDERMLRAMLALPQIFARPS
ncbi:MAG TPA: polysaccharide deacetylase family protein [Capillimicrobium sp.]|nr:polysaccharide deacetylase family protein [Capillimicrobium sp.]